MNIQFIITENVKYYADTDIKVMHFFISKSS